MQRSLVRSAPTGGVCRTTRPIASRVSRKTCVPCKAFAVESVKGISEELEKAIDNALDKCLTQTNLDVGKKKQGKVRDTYDLGDKVAIVTTDRQTAFDRLLATVPFKGQVLNQTAAWWFQNTTHIVPNALISTPDPNVSVMKKCTVFPVEFVVRGYLTGSTDTSLWTHYKNGSRDYCGNKLPEGLRKNDKLKHNIITPTTKEETHDVPISAADIVKQGLMTQAEWDKVSAASLALFEFGQQQAAKQGLLLVDTKYEFGKDEQGNVMLIDEIHTPDSSRYWIADSYSARHAAGKEPEMIDKEFLRLWFREHCDPYNDKVLPPAPKELVKELSKRYILLYQMITGKEFVAPYLDKPIEQRVAQNLRSFL